MTEYSAEFWLIRRTTRRVRDWPWQLWRPKTGQVACYMREAVPLTANQFEQLSAGNIALDEAMRAARFRKLARNEEAQTMRLISAFTPEGLLPRPGA